MNGCEEPRKQRTADELKEEILGLVEEATRLVPDGLLPPLPPTDIVPEAPAWHPHEHEIWRIGEEIRQLLQSIPKLRSDPDLQQAYVRIIGDRKAGRGRQSFFFLLEFKSCQPCASAVASELDDPDTTGHAISTLRKMRADGYVKEVREYADDPTTWVRNEARKYLARYDSDQR